MVSFYKSIINFKLLYIINDILLYQEYCYK